MRLLIRASAGQRPDATRVRMVRPLCVFNGVLLAVRPLTARNSDSKYTWSPGPVTNTSLAHELWKVPLPPKGITAPSRPPPGLTGQKPPSSWENNSLRLGGWGGSDSRFTPGKGTPAWGSALGFDEFRLLIGVLFVLRPGTQQF